MLFFDPLYIVLLVVTLAITGWAAWRVRSTYAKWAKVDSGLNLDAFDFARRLRAPVRVVAGCGHLVPMERPDAFFDAIDSLLLGPAAEPRNAP